MIYGKLPSRDLLRKLAAISFSTPGKNLNVFRYCEAAKTELEAFDAVRNKIIRRYGIQDKNEPMSYKIPAEKRESYLKDIKELLDTECGSKIPDHDLTESDFADGACFYPEEPSLWLSAADIDAILHFTEEKEP